MIVERARWPHGAHAQPSAAQALLEFKPEHVFHVGRQHGNLTGRHALPAAVAVWPRCPALLPVYVVSYGSFPL